jgi:hypothetical protein
VVHRASAHRATGLFEFGEKASVVEQRRLVAKRPAVDPGRSPPVDGNRCRFSFRHAANVGTTALAVLHARSSAYIRSCRSGCGRWLDDLADERAPLASGSTSRDEHGGEHREIRLVGETQAVKVGRLEPSHSVVLVRHGVQGCCQPAIKAREESLPAFAQALRVELPDLLDAGEQTGWQLRKAGVRIKGGPGGVDCGIPPADLGLADPALPTRASRCQALSDTYARACRRDRPQRYRAGRRRSGTRPGQMFPR